MSYFHVHRLSQQTQTDSRRLTALMFTVNPISMKKIELADVSSLTPFLLSFVRIHIESVHQSNARQQVYFYIFLKLTRAPRCCKIELKLASNCLYYLAFGLFKQQFLAIATAVHVFVVVRY